MQTIEEILLDFKSHRNYKYSAKLIAQNKTFVDDLLRYCLTLKYPYPQYSSWLLSHVAENHLEFILQFHSKIIDTFLDCQEPSTQRNLCNVLTKLPKIEYREGELLDTYFAFLQSSETKVALKVYSMYQIVDFLKDYPELKSELKIIIEDGIKKETPAFAAASRKVLKQISKM
jgi:hypothetical protein